jgi:hypothetical protein
VTPDKRRPSNAMAHIHCCSDSNNMRTKAHFSQHSGDGKVLRIGGQ